MQNYLKNGSRINNIQDIPTDFIPKNLHKYLYQKIDCRKALIESRYETLIYAKLKNKIDSSDIFTPDSTQYCSLENDLADETYFRDNMNQICNDLGNSFLINDLTKETENILKSILLNHHSR